MSLKISKFIIKPQRKEIRSWSTCSLPWRCAKFESIYFWVRFLKLSKEVSSQLFKGNTDFVAVGGTGRAMAEPDENRFTGLQCQRLARMILLGMNCSDVRYSEVARLLCAGSRVMGFHANTRRLCSPRGQGLCVWHPVFIMLNTGPYPLAPCSVNGLAALHTRHTNQLVVGEFRESFLSPLVLWCALYCTVLPGFTLWCLLFWGFLKKIPGL